MTTEEQIGEYLHSLGITQSARAFTALVSNVYHKWEAEIYDSAHEEVFETSAHWCDCLNRIAGELPNSVRVLDIGAGTGFASEQVLKAIGPRLGQLVCQDLSTDMLGRCRARLQHVAPGISERTCFVAGDVECLARASDELCFDLVVTNSVLHHLIDLAGFFNIIKRLMRPGGFYVAGHEPSYEFYATPSVNRWTAFYRRWRRLRRLLKVETYRRRLGLVPGPKNLERLTNETLMQMGAITAALPPGVVRQLVDVHIPPAKREVPFWGERGFSPDGLLNKFLPHHELRHLITYAHITDAQARMGATWRMIDRRLAKKYPMSGASFLMAVRRVA